MKSFDKWVDELRDQVNKQPELPDGIIEGNVDGEYLYQCRSCGDWNPIDWDLDEDSYESHYCGKDPRCCPLPSAPTANPVPVAPKGDPRVVRGQPKANPVPTPADPFYSQYEVCAGCNTRIPLSQTFRHPKTGDPFCGAQVCYDALAYGYGQTPKAQPQIDSSHFKCQGCNGRYHIRDAKTHPRTGEAFCGRTSCGIKIQQNRP